MRILTALLIAVSFFAAAQSPEVPHKMSFAGMTLTIRDDARREIQKDVDALTQSPKHFNIKADRARTYFPVIEKIFSEEGVPDDFKFLVLQESSLVADAVSVSNAVGFWQFKDFTAIEMGLRVDREIDERMNIAASTRAAAKYIKKNNSFFDNWLYALQAYQMGAGGVMRSLDEEVTGEKHAEITSKTYWYVKKFLSYKIAFEESVRGKGQTDLTIYENKTDKSLADISREMSIDEEELKSYNKWTKSGFIPGDRTYVVVVPFKTGVALPEIKSVAKAEPVREDVKASSQKPAVSVKLQTVRINNIPAVMALAGESPAQMATRAGVDLVSFLKWNDISYTTTLIPGAYYFLAKKRTRAQENFHTLAKGEDIWSVSQKYGVQLRKLKKYNRLEAAFVAPGTTVWLSSRKPKSARNEAPAEDAVELAQDDTFSWSANSESVVVAATTVAEKVEPSPVVEENPEETTNLNATDSLKTLQPLKESQVFADTIGMVVFPPVQGDKGSHIVQPKETLYAIAKVYNVTVMDLVAWNNLDLQQGIRIGQVLKVSQPETSSAPPETKDVLHEVQASDTLYSIARKYGVTIKEIMDWNEKKDFSLTIGEKLKVKAVQ